MTMSRFALAAVAAAVLAGCSTTKLEETPKAPVETRQSTPTQPTPPKAPESAVKTVDLAAEQLAAVADKRVIYFDFDSYVVKDEFRPTVEAHAKRLNLIKTQKVSLEGHADERGSREYNLALGQKRADAVRKALSLLGVSESQIESVSLGEEKPSCNEASEACWSANRRGDMLYSGEF